MVRLSLLTADITVLNHRLTLLEEGEKNLTDKFKEAAWSTNFHQIYFKFLDLKFLSINYYLLRKKSLCFTFQIWAFSYILI